MFDHFHNEYHVFWSFTLPALPLQLLVAPGNMPHSGLHAFVSFPESSCCFGVAAATSPSQSDHQLLITPQLGMRTYAPLAHQCLKVTSFISWWIHAVSKRCHDSCPDDTDSQQSFPASVSLSFCHFLHDVPWLQAGLGW